MTDVADLAFRIDDRGLLRGGKALDDLASKAIKAESATDRMIAASERLGASMSSLGRTLSMRVTAPLAAIGAAALKVGGDFQYSMNRVAVLSRATGDELEALREQARELGRTTQFTASQAADAMGFLAMAGFRANEVLGTMPATLDLAAASGMELARTADVMSNIMQGYGLATTDAGRASDVLVAAMTRSNTNLEQLGQAMKFAGPVAKGMGISFEEAAAALGMMGNAGYQAGMAGTSLRNALARLASPTGSAADVMRDLGLNVTNADGSMKSLTEIVEQLERSGASTTQMLDLFGYRAGPAMDALVGQGSEALRGLTTELEDSVGEAARVASVQMEGFRGSMLALKSAAEGVLIAVSESGLLEWAASLADRMTGLLQRVAEMNPALLRTTAIIAGVAAAIGPALVVMGALIASIKTIIPVIAGTAGLIKAIYGLRVALIALSGPVGIIAGIITGLTIHYINHRREIERLKTPTEEATNALNRMREATQGDLGDQDIKSFQSALGDLNREIAETQTRMERMIETRIMMSRVGGMRSEVGDFSAGRESAELAAMQERLDTMREARAVEEQRLAIARQFPTQAERNAAAQQFWNDATDKGRKILERFGIVLPEAADAARDLASGLDDAGNSAGDASDEFETLLDRLLAANDAIQAGIELPQRYADAMINLAGSLVQAATGMNIFAQTQRSMDSGGQGIFPDFGMLGTALDGMKEIREEMEKAARIEWSFENLLDSFHPLSQAMRRLSEDIELVNARIETGQMSDMEGMFMKTGMAASAAFGAIMAGMDESSSEYQAMAVAQQAMNTFLGIGAILQTAATAPWPANFVAMAQMASMVASLIGSVGSLGGGGGNLAASRQATQGTGTVLGDPDAKSESIANALDITADATSALVGINRGMLHALQAMQQGIAGAATILARGGLNFDLSSLSLGSSDWGMTSTRVADMGLSMGGGTISQMADSASAQTYATTRKSNIFSTSYRTAYEEAGEDLNNQLALVFRSMIDTVTEAGKSLGISQAEIEDRVRSFRVAAFEISLMDLSAEEQQQEIEAVFSAIFDDLASHVIPFIGQFQQIGEGMAETLIRVATSVQVTEEAIGRLGLQISDGLGPEKMAQVSVGLIEAAGGIEEFISQMENFVAKFAPEAHRFEIAQSDVTRALEQMNLALPESREGFWNLMQSIDGSTEAGQRHIATLLSLADAADTFYSGLEDMEKDRQQLLTRLAEINGTEEALLERRIEAARERTDELMGSLGLHFNLDRGSTEDLARWFEALNERIGDADPAGFIAAGEALLELIELEERLADSRKQLTDFMESIDMAFLDATQPAMASLKRLVDRWADMEEQATDLGASEDQLARVRRAARAEMARWISDMRLSTLRLAEDFFSVDQSFQQVGTSVNRTIDNMRDKALRALAGIDEWLMSSQLDSNSPLTPQQRLDAAESQFRNALQAAMSGDFDALASLPQLADRFLGEAGGFFGTSTDQFRAIWDEVRAMMDQAADIEPPREAQPVNAAQIDTLNATVSSFAADISALEQELKAWQLGDQINSLATAMGRTPAEIAEELGFSQGQMKMILENLGVDITGVSASNFTDFFNDTISSLEDGSPLLKALNGGHGSIAWAIGILEPNLWLIGDVLVQILGVLGGEYAPPEWAQGPTHQGGPVDEGGLYGLTAGEGIVPRNGTISSGSGTSQDFAEVKMELERIGRHIERGNSDRREGLGAIVREGQSTRRTLSQRSKTVRAV